MLVKTLSPLPKCRVLFKSGTHIFYTQGGNCVLLQCWVFLNIWVQLNQTWETLHILSPLYPSPYLISFVTCIHKLNIKLENEICIQMLSPDINLKLYNFEGFRTLNLKLSKPGSFKTLKHSNLVMASTGCPKKNRNIRKLSKFI